MKIRFKWTWANILILSVFTLVTIPFMAYGLEWLLRGFFSILEAVVHCV